MLIQGVFQGFAAAGAQTFIDTEQVITDKPALSVIVPKQNTLPIVAGGLQGQGFTPGTTLLSGRVVGESRDRFGVQMDGQMGWTDGLNPADVTLLREAAGLLKLIATLHTVDNVICDGIIAIKAGTGFKAWITHANAEDLFFTLPGEPGVIFVLPAGQTTVPIGKGGTGSTTAAGARENLGVYPMADVYTKTEVDNLLAQKANVGHGHTFAGVSVPDHSHSDPQGGSTGPGGAHTPSGTVS